MAWKAELTQIWSHWTIPAPHIVFHLFFLPHTWKDWLASQVLTLVPAQPRTMSFPFKRWDDKSAPIYKSRERGGEGLENGIGFQTILILSLWYCWYNKSNFPPATHRSQAISQQMLQISLYASPLCNNLIYPTQVTTFSASFNAQLLLRRIQLWIQNVFSS